MRNSFQVLPFTSEIRLKISSYKSAQEQQIHSYLHNIFLNITSQRQPLSSVISVENKIKKCDKIALNASLPNTSLCV